MVERPLFPDENYVVSGCQQSAGSPKLLSDINL